VRRILSFNRAVSDVPWPLVRFALPTVHLYVATVPVAVSEAYYDPDGFKEVWKEGIGTVGALGVKPECGSRF